MILNLLKTNAGWTDQKFSVAFNVEPEDRLRLDLATGEVFQNSRYAALRKQADKAIEATLFVIEKSEEVEGAQRKGAMTYREGGAEYAAQLWFMIWLSKEKLAEFHSFIKAGRLPGQATIFLAWEGITFGNAPDGSEQKWDNLALTAIDIEDFSFSFEFPPRIQANLPFREEPEDDYDRAFFTDIAQANYGIYRRLVRLEHALTSRPISVTNVLIVLALGFVIWRLMR